MTNQTLESFTFAVPNGYEDERLWEEEVEMQGEPTPDEMAPLTDADLEAMSDEQLAARYSRIVNLRYEMDIAAFGIPTLPEEWFYEAARLDTRALRVFIEQARRKRFSKPDGAGEES